MNIIFTLLNNSIESAGIALLLVVAIMGLTIALIKGLKVRVRFEPLSILSLVLTALLLFTSLTVTLAASNAKSTVTNIKENINSLNISELPTGGGVIFYKKLTR